MSDFVDVLSQAAELVILHWRNSRTSVKIFATLSAILVARVIAYKVYRVYKHYPPGPIGIPFFCSAIAFGVNRDKFLYNIGAKNPVTLIYLIQKPTIILNDPKLINSIFNNHVLSRALNNRSPHFVDIDQHQIMTVPNYYNWLPRRKLLQTALPRVLNNSCLDNITLYLFNNMLFDTIRKETNNFTQCMLSTNNVFMRYQFCMLFEATFGNIEKKVSNDEMEKFAKETIDLIDFALSKASKFAFWRFARITPSFVKRQYQEVLKIRFERTESLIKEFIKKSTKYDVENVGNEKNMIDKDEQTTFIMDTYMQALQHPEKYSLKDGNVQKEHQLEPFEMIDVYGDIMLLFFAGMETTSNTLEYIVCELAKHQKLQNEIYNEIKQYLEQNKIPVKVSDTNSGKTIDTSRVDFKHNLAIFRAFIWECMRLLVAAPVGLPHEGEPSFITNNEYLTSSNEIKIKFEEKEYVIPKNSLIFLNLMHANRNAKCWINNENKGQTDKLCVSHWLKLDTETGKKIFVKNPNFVAFGSGRRDCVGKQFATNILYRVLINLIINFQIYGPNGPKLGCDIDDTINTNTFQVGFTRAIKPKIPIKMIPRK